MFPREAGTDQNRLLAASLCDDDPVKSSRCRTIRTNFRTPERFGCTHFRLMYLAFPVSDQSLKETTDCPVSPAVTLPRRPTFAAALSRREAASSISALEPRTDISDWNSLIPLISLKIGQLHPRSKRMRASFAIAPGSEVSVQVADRTTARFRPP